MVQEPLSKPSRAATALNQEAKEIVREPQAGG
jgi:hypothetical protein